MSEREGARAVGRRGAGARSSRPAFLLGVTALLLSLVMAAAAKRVVIVGGGISGVSSAYYLAKRGVRSTLIDPVGIAPAASGKAGGFLALDWNDGSAVGPLARRSFALHEELSEAFGPATIDYRRLTCEAIGIGGRGPMSQRKVQGVEKLQGVEWADVGVLGSRPMGGTDTIAQVHPRKLTEAMWAEAVRLAGSELLIGKAEGIELDAAKEAVVGVALSGGAVQPCECVLLAMGPWSPKWLGLPQSFGQKYHSILMEPDRTLSQCVFFQGLGDPEVYPRPDGSVYVTGFPDQPAPVSELPGQVEVRKDVVERLASTMRQVSTEFEKAPVTLEQSCHLPLCADGTPVIGAVPRVSGAYIATGAGCWGILCGPATGLAMAELIVDGEASSVDLKPFDPCRLM